MGKSLLQEFSTKERLNQSWQLMRHSTAKHKHEYIGSDGLSIAAIEKQKQFYINSLSIQLRTNTYLPDNLTAHFIPKPHSTKERVICVPTLRDRLAQRCLLQYLHDKGYQLNNKISYGFVKGLGSAVKLAGAQAVNLRNQYQWAYKADISAFFDNVDRTLLKQIVKNKLRCKSIHNLIYKMIDSEIDRSSPMIDQRLTDKGIIKKQGLRQGMPISPYLSNLYLAEFDKAAIKANIPMIRYADDIIAFAKTEKECLSIHEFCKRELEKLGLHIPDIEEHDKTTIASPEQTIEFLGLGISKDNKSKYKLILTEDQLKKIKSNLYELSDLNYCHKNKITIGKLIQKIDSRIKGYENAYDICSNIESISESLNDTKINVISKILSSNFEINIQKLSKKKKIFLELEI